MKLMTYGADIPDSDYEIVESVQNKLAFKMDKKYDTKVIYITIQGVY